MKQGIYHAGNRIVFLYILSILVVFSLASAIPIIHDITVADNPSYEGEEILFSANVSSNSSNNSLLNSTWDFGDGEHAFTILAFHAYADNGVYTASLMVCDIEGCDTADVNVTVLNRNPIVLFLNESYYCDEGGNVLLAPNITDVPADTLTYQWSTGENTSSIIYSCGNGDDIVQVSLTVEDDDGGEGDASTDVLISNVAPTADPHGPYKTAAGHEVCFMGSASDPYDTEFEFMWDFDYDGDFDTDGEGENPCTTYTTSGTYTLGLIVDDGEGEGESESEIATTTVVVYDYGIPLSLGENLFSIPLVPYRPQGFVDTRIDFVLGGDVVQNADIIWEFRWDNTLQRNVWRYNEPNATKTGWNTHPERIQRIHPGYGYIMLMDNETILYGNGRKYYDFSITGVFPRMQLTPGLNLIGHYGMNNVPKSAEIDDLEIFGESSLHLADMTLLDYENNFVDTLIPGKGYWTIINATTNVFYVPSEADYHEGEL